ncbi:hypothetical protein Tiera_030 [Polaromonas phage Tiera]|nr:hypothetical protein Tiera_030 [Polaromonas phage Tiera]
MNAPANAKPKATLLDLDSLMDTKLDSVATLPDFMNPPNGLYRLAVTEAGLKKYDVKDEAGKATGDSAHRISITYKVVTTREYDSSELPVPDGTLFTEGFQGTEQGLEYFKKRAMGILNVKEFDGASLGDIFTGLVNEEFEAKLTTKTAKVGNKEYENLQIRILPKVED